MRIFSRLLLPLPFFVCLWATPQAFGHENLVQPPLRDDTNQKVPPCGGVPWGSHVTTLEPGAQLELLWVETIAHPGWFRISFRAAESGDFNDHILLPKVNSLDRVADYSQLVTLPDIETSEGSIQLAFVMTDKPNAAWPYGYEEYSNCTDIVLTRDANSLQASPQPSTSPTASAGDANTSVAGSPNAVAPVPSPTASDMDAAGFGGADGAGETGCTASGAHGSRGLAVCAACAVLVARRLRRRRKPARQRPRN